VVLVGTHSATSVRHSASNPSSRRSWHLATKQELELVLLRRVPSVASMTTWDTIKHSHRWRCRYHGTKSVVRWHQERGVVARWYDASYQRKRAHANNKTRFCRFCLHGCYNELEALFSWGVSLRAGVANQIDRFKFWKFESPERKKRIQTQDSRINTRCTTSRIPCLLACAPRTCDRRRSRPSSRVLRRDNTIEGLLRTELEPCFYLVVR